MKKYDEYDNEDYTEDKEHYYSRDEIEIAQERESRRRNIELCGASVVVLAGKLFVNGELVED